MLQIPSSTHGTKAISSHFKGPSTSFTESHPNNCPTVSRKVKGMQKWSPAWIYTCKSEKLGLQHLAETCILKKGKKKGMFKKIPTFLSVSKISGQTLLLLTLLSNALIQLFRAAWAVNLETYRCSAHKAVFWDTYMHISTWIINSMQLVLIATPLRLCTASIRNHQLLLFDHKLQWFELHGSLSFHHKEHQTSSKLLQKILKVWLRHLGNFKSSEFS